VGDTEAEPEEV
jgi:hypothetical protein